MKSTLITFAIIASGSLVVPAQVELKQDSAGLVTLRDAWQRSVVQATIPLDNKYRQALVKLKTNLTRVGNLQDALAVDAEIKKLDARGESRALEPRGDSLSASNAVLGVWSITFPDGQSNRREVFKDGTWKEPQDNRAGKTWKVFGDRIVFLFPDGGTDWFILPINSNGTKGKTIHGAEFTAVLAPKQ